MGKLFDAVSRILLMRMRPRQSHTQSLVLLLIVGALIAYFVRIAFLEYYGPMINAVNSMATSG